MAKGWKITRSNYTLKEPHKKLPNGSIIYERDYMTTTNLGGFDSGSIPYGDGNFKILTSNSTENRKHHKNGNWEKASNCDATTQLDCTIWTLNNISNETQSTESSIIRKPNTNDLLDFVYYGSCSELIKVSVANIISKYPAELYISDLDYSIIGNNGDVVLGSNILNKPVVVSNPFQIDITSKISGAQQGNNDINALRFFCDNYQNYILIDKDDKEVGCLEGWNVTAKTSKKCHKDGDLYAVVDLSFSGGEKIAIYVYFVGDSYVFITDGNEKLGYVGYKIRPKKSIITKIFEEDFSQFEQLLLNRNSKPIYTATINTPTETNQGVVYCLKPYTWKTLYGWNLDVTTSNYQQYLSSLLSVAEFYDEHNTDNLWKNMTHEAIRNLDVSKKLNIDKNGDEDYADGNGYIRGFMLACGRQFDEIKYDIDNIKTTNTITYDENNNLPDYFLSDTLTLSGWEISSIANSLSSDTTVSSLYPGDDKSYDTNSLNTQFLRNLKINSKAILQAKGTRNAIEMLFSLFGFSSYDFGANYYNSLPNSRKTQKNGTFLDWNNLSEPEQSAFYDYKLNEYVVVASNNEEDIVDVNEELPAETYNAFKNYEYGEGSNNTVFGLPVRIVSVTYDENGESTSHKYLIPWFDKYSFLDGNPYFQMYGGWTQNMDGNFEETKQYLNVVSTIGELLSIVPSNLNDGQIVYVEDISDISDYVLVSYKPSNYFRLNSTDYANLFSITEKGDGWYNIPQGDIDNEIKYGIEVVRLESIIDDNTGNNPHVGYGQYDSGQEYLEYFRQIFRGAIKNDYFGDDAYDCETGELLPEIKNAGFTLTAPVVDNMKCWFFSDNAQDNNIYHVYKKYTSVEDEFGDEYNIPVGYEEATYKTTVNVGENASLSKETFFETKLNAFNFETRDVGSNDEAAANSIINIKKITIEFNHEKYSDNKDFKNFLNSAILPYLKQIIPSTTILEIVNIDSNSYSTDC